MPRSLSSKNRQQPRISKIMATKWKPLNGSWKESLRLAGKRWEKTDTYCSWPIITILTYVLNIAEKTFENLETPSHIVIPILQNHIWHFWDTVLQPGHVKVVFPPLQHRKGLITSCTKSTGVKRKPWRSLSRRSSQRVTSSLFFPVYRRCLTGCSPHSVWGHHNILIFTLITSL